MASGIVVSQRVIDLFQRLTNGKKGCDKIYGFTAHIEEEEVVVDEESIIEEEDGAYFKIVENSLKEDKCLFAFLEFHCSLEENRRVECVTMISWVPDKCKIKDRMLMSSTKAAVKTKLGNVGNEVNWNCKGDIDFNDLIHGMASVKMMPVLTVDGRRVKGKTGHWHLE